MFPLIGTLYSLYGYRVDCSTKENGCAVLAPGQLPKKPAVDINVYHCAAGHSHEVLLRKTTEQQEIVSRESYLSAEGALWRRVSAKVSRNQLTHEQIRSSGEVLWI